LGPAMLGFLLLDEVMDGIEPGQSDDNEIDRDNDIEKPRHDQDQNAGDECDNRRDMGGGDNHWISYRFCFGNGRDMPMQCGGAPRGINARAAVRFYATNAAVSSRSGLTVHINARLPLAAGPSAPTGGAGSPANRSILSMRSACVPNFS
jgi:hypothetical protein